VAEQRIPDPHMAGNGAAHHAGQQHRAGHGGPRHEVEDQDHEFDEPDRPRHIRGEAQLPKGIEDRLDRDQLDSGVEGHEGADQPGEPPSDPVSQNAWHAPSLPAAYTGSPFSQ